MSFLNNEANVIHGNLRSSSIFLTSAGEFKLAGFEVSSALKDEESLIFDYAEVFSDGNHRDWPSEVTSPSSSLSWRQLRSFPAFTVDSFMMARLLVDVFPKSLKIPHELSSFIQDASSTDYRRRPNPRSLLTTGAWIRNVKIIDIADKLDSMSVMDFEQRENFLRQVHTCIDQLPRDFVSCKIVPSLADLFQISSSQESLAGIKLFLSAAANTSSADMQSVVVPTLTKLFTKPDRAVRLTLLEFIPCVIEKLDSKVIQEHIYPHVVSGFTDALPALRESTLKASILLAPNLTPRQLNGELLRFYARLQSDEQPGIRVNTTVCIGKLAKLLDEGTRLKVLGVAFVRALRDPFIPSRAAALAAILATKDLLGNDEIALNLLPNVIPLIIDADRGVREAAVKTSEQLLQRIVTYSTTLPDIKPSSPSVEPQPGIREKSKESAASSWGITSLADKIIGHTSEEAPLNTLASAANVNTHSYNRGSSVKSMPTLDSTKNSDGWGTQDDLIDISAYDDKAEGSPPAWEDDDNPWNQEPSLASTSSRRQAPVVQSSLVRTTIRSSAQSTSRAMTLGKTKSKLSDQL